MPVAGRQIAGRHRHVGGGEAQLGAAPVVPVGHHAPHLVGPAQQLGRRLDPSPADQAPDAGGGDGLGRLAGPGGVGAQGHPVHLEAGAGPHLGQEGHVALAPVAEVEVLAHHHQPGPQSAHQDRSPRTPRPSRWPAPRRSGPRRCGPPRPPPGAPASGRGRRAAGGRTRGAPRWPGWRSKVTTAVVSPSVAGPLAQLGQEGPMAQVDAVVGADGHRGSPLRRDAGREVGHDVHHRGRLPPRPGRPVRAGPVARPIPASGRWVIRRPPGPRPGGSGRSRWPRTRPAGDGPRPPAPTDRRR